jgi:hypothetical protein
VKVSKWVDFGLEVDVEVGVDDIRVALAEAFANVTDDRLGEEGPSRHDISRAINCIALFLKALTDEHIALLTQGQREIIGKFLSESAARFERSTVEG